MRVRPVIPDSLDFRDRRFAPSVSRAPLAELYSTASQLEPERVLDQGKSSACTGFALATVVERLMVGAQWGAVAGSDRVSPYMLYSMALRYDELAGENTKTGSTLRGVLKGWFKHGACRRELWDGASMPPPNENPVADWWQDAALRPLGAYYRIDAHDLAAIRVALNETGVVVASAATHDGWDVPSHADDAGGICQIAYASPGVVDAGHAFAIVGYNSEGFVIQNSWGTNWGTHGYAVLRYDDWLENAMDCWVAQLGVRTAIHREISRAKSLRVMHGQVRLAKDETLRNREISPFIVNVENDGRLSDSGLFRTQSSDLEALIKIHLAEAIDKWHPGASTPTVDIAIYAHGGLVSEDDAAETASHWIPRLYQAQIFPIFLMWETGLWKTLSNIVEDGLRGATMPVARSILDREFWLNRAEGAISPFGTPVWSEIKENAARMARGADGSLNKSSGMIQLYEAAKQAGYFTATPRANVRLHMIGHSAGSIVLAHAIDVLMEQHAEFELASLTLMAPAMRADLFKETILPRLGRGRPRPKIRRYTQFHLADEVEQRDPTCGPYRRSLLYLVSNAFERPRGAAILGLERDWLRLSAEHGGGSPSRWTGFGGRVRAFSAPCVESGAATHGAFDDLSDNTSETVIGLIAAQRGL